MVRIRVPSMGELPDAFGLVEEGDWQAQATKIEEGESRAGNQMIVVTWRVLNGPSKGQSLRNWIVLEPADALFNLKQLLLAYGCDEEETDVDFNTDDMIGMTAILKVVHEQYTTDSGQERTRHSISETLLDDDNRVSYTPRRAPARQEQRTRPAAGGGSSGGSGGGSRERDRGNRPDRPSRSAPPARQTRPAAPPPAEDDDDDDLPF